MFIDVNGSGDQFDTAGLLSQMLNNSGYADPSQAGHSLSTGGGDSSEISSPEKSSTIANAFGGGLSGNKDDAPASPARQNVMIQMLAPSGDVNEKWILVNPLIKSIKFGELSYDSDDPVEYEMEIVYDYAIFGDPA